MRRPERLKGSFGGQKTSTQTSSPVEQDDSLQNNQIAWLIDLLSEGPIAGLCDRNWNVITNGNINGQAVFFDQTQLMTDSYEMTYSDVAVGLMPGYDTQGPLTNFSTAADTVSMGVNLLADQPVTFSIDDPNTTRVAVGIRYPGLQQQDDKGNIKGYDVNVGIMISLNGGPFLPADSPQGGNGSFPLSGKCSSDYTREINIGLPRSSNPQVDYWQIQVSRRSPNDKDSKHHSGTILDYYTRIVDANLTYPGSAYAYVGINSKSLSSIPVRGYRIKGRLIQIPTNYFPETRRYTRAYWNGGDAGINLPWNGTFYTAWSNNPAWVFYDIATNTRFGAGEFIGNGIDIWALYEIAQYCDELVPDGHGGQEPRFTLNTYVQTIQQAWKVLSDFASCFRGLIYWGGGSIVPVQDRPKPILQVFTNANVVNAMFSYSDTEIKNRQSDATVSWNDPDDFFNTKLERVTNQEARLKYRTREVQFAAFGCTSRGQAARAGNYLLETNLIETETVTFQTGLEGAYLRPGDIIGIADNDRIGLRYGGRVKGVAPIAGHVEVYVTLDAPIVAQADWTQIWFYAARDAQTPDDVQIGDYYASERAESNHPSLLSLGFVFGMNGLANNTVAVQFRASNIVPPVGSPAAAYPIDQMMTKVGGNSIPCPATIGPGTIWVLSSNYYKPLELPVSTYRIIDITEKETHILQITGVTYQEGKYNEIDFGVQFEKPLLTRLPGITFVMQPNNLTASLNVTVTNEGVTKSINLSWEPPPDPMARIYRIYKQYESETFGLVGEVQSTSFTHLAEIAGLYNFRVHTVNLMQAVSAAASVSVKVPDTSMIENARTSGLELKNQGNDAFYHVTDPVIEWRLHAPSRYFEMSSQEPYGAASGGYDPYFKYYEVSVYEAETNILGWKDQTTDLSYTILYSKNIASWGDAKPRHHLTVYVQLIDTYNSQHYLEYLEIDNPPPPPPKFLVVTPGESRATLEWIVTYAIDLAKINIYRSTTANKKDAIFIATCSSHATNYTTGPMSAGTYYFAITQVDTFGTESSMTGLVSVSIV